MRNQNYYFTTLPLVSCDADRQRSLRQLGVEIAVSRSDSLVYLKLSSETLPLFEEFKKEHHLDCVLQLRQDSNSTRLVSELSLEDCKAELIYLKHLTAESAANEMALRRLLEVTHLLDANENKVEPIIGKTYNTLGEVVPALTKDYAHYYVKDTNWKPCERLAPEFCGNELWCYSNDAGDALLVVTLAEDNVPVAILERFDSIKTCKNELEYVIDTTNVGTYNAEKSPLLAVLSSKRPGYLPDKFHFLSEIFNGDDYAGFFQLYRTTIEKINRLKPQYLPHENFPRAEFDDKEVEILKLLAFCEVTSDIFGKNRRLVQNLCKSLPHLNPVVLEKLGIREDSVDRYFKKNGLSLGYFFDRIEQGSEVAAYFVDYPDLNSYFKPENEVIAWRLKTTNMKRQFDHFKQCLIDSEPADRP